MGSNKNSGQVTVFLSIVLLAVIVLAGVLVDASRISSGEALAKKAVNSAARSVLAGYGSRLKENYGLFAFNSAGEEEMNDVVRAYIEKNLEISSKGDKIAGSVDLYGFRVEKLNVTPLYNLSENKVFKQQILEYMKYRAPKEIVEGFVERLAAIKDIGRMSVAYKKKVGIDKILGKMDKAQQSLKMNVDGSGKANEKYINGFNPDGICQDALSNLINSKNDRKALEAELDGINAELADLQKPGSAQEGTADEGENDGQSRIDKLKSKKNSLRNKISELSHKIDEIWTDLRYTLTGGYIAPNEKAVAQIAEIVETGKRAESQIAELENYIEEFFSTGDSYSINFTDTLTGDVKKIKDMIISGEKASEMMGELESNRSVLSGIIEKLDLLKGVIDGGAADSDSIGTLENAILDMFEEYSRVEYSYEKPEKGKAVEDPRKDKVKELKDALLVKLLNDRNFIDAGIVEAELPSVKKDASRNFDLEDAPYTGQGASGSAGEAEKGLGVGYAGKLDNMAGDVDLYDEDGTFQENALDFAGGLGKLLEGDIVRLRDNIYINEYIMGMFKNLVPVVRQDENSGSAAFLNGVPREGKDTFYECEVEYILHGSASEITNRVMTSAQILLVRLGADTLHVYNDAKKRELSVAAASAVAGWWTGGAGIPVLSNLIMCAWGMGEAIIDVKDLTEGKLVPIYKAPGDWKLDIGLPKASGPETSPGLCFSYHDYLRLFLLAMDEDVKLGRAEDLIEINTGLKKPGFKASDCYTYLRVEAEISMKNLFITRSFIPESKRTQDGRRIIRILVYEGY